MSYYDEVSVTDAARLDSVSDGFQVGLAERAEIRALYGRPRTIHGFRTPAEVYRYAVVGGGWA
ncbi:hypothetical protein [Streptomyces sp. A1136]|uniref:hypothetical protein n=1 Tax=Streptomyces sp. A1136 TaxID=2563102 RepID=UPI00109E9C51|nr:hypothetical protein [Streptomyces sp. A1136]THA44566.1 hypothetical protein E6R62_36715 [Streptomyces sp. A1136]